MTQSGINTVLGLANLGSCWYNYFDRNKDQQKAVSFQTKKFQSLVELLASNETIPESSSQELLSALDAVKSAYEAKIARLESQVASLSTRLNELDAMKTSMDTVLAFVKKCTTLISDSNLQLLVAKLNGYEQSLSAITKSVNSLLTKDGSNEGSSVSVGLSMFLSDERNTAAIMSAPGFAVNGGQFSESDLENFKTLISDIQQSELLSSELLDYVKDLGAVESSSIADLQTRAKTIIDKYPKVKSLIG